MGCSSSVEVKEEDQSQNIRKSLKIIEENKDDLIKWISEENIDKIKEVVYAEFNPNVAFETTKNEISSLMLLTIKLEKHQVFDYFINFKMDVNSLISSNNDFLLKEALHIENYYFVEKLIEKGAKTLNANIDLVKICDDQIVQKERKQSFYNDSEIEKSIIQLKKILQVLKEVQQKELSKKS